MEEVVDVIVVGSGAAGLTSALVAGSLGLSVTILEKAPVFGGSTVVSGGSIWAPVNRYMAAEGRDDSRDDALEYIRRLTLGRVDDSLIERFVDTVNPMVEFVSAETTIEFTPNLEHPDYQPDLPGARHGGRTLQVGLYDSKCLGELRTKLRPTHSTVPITKREHDEWGEDTLDRWDWALIAQRTKDGIVGMGAALAGELLDACLRHGAVLHTGARACELLRDGDRVTGAVVTDEDGLHRVTATRGVVLASGGFEWDPALVDGFLGVPMVAPASPPSNEGDGLRMAMSVGAALGNMTEAWWGPMVDAVGDTYDGKPLHRPTSGLRTLPGGIIVNRSGKRFVDEAMNYNDFGKALAHFDPVGYEYSNLPCWLIFDERFRQSYSITTVTPDSPTPRWISHAPTLTELARTVGIDADGLEEQVSAFNVHAAQGKDPEFHRGTSAYDLYRGDRRVSPHRNLRPLESGPYYAVQLHFGCLGTKGGPVTDDRGQVLDVNGGRIAGLYACGNVAASVFGPGYPGAGATLAAAMTFGFLIGNALGATS